MNTTAENRSSDLMRTQPEGHQLSVWKKSLFAAVAFFVFASIAELVLGLCRIRPILYDEDPYVGFTSYIPLFIEKQGPDDSTAMVTAKNKLVFFNSQRFVKDKSVDTYRIFCVGGSTTFGRPYNDTTSFCGWLRELLSKSDSSHRWELINAGGISYASYRVALLMEELIRYEPDLFIIYTGHNEFLERRTYSRIVEMPSSVRGLGAFFSRTRTYALGKYFSDVWDRRSFPQDDELTGEVETLLEKSVGPIAYHRDVELRSQILDHYHFNLRRMIEMTRSVGADVILVTPASNLRDCSPFKSEHCHRLNAAERNRWDLLFEQANQSHEKGDWQNALSTIDQAARIDDQYAQLHFLRGQILSAMKCWGEAKAAFVRARDEDVCPLRALTPMRDIVMKVAEEQAVSFVDFAGLVEQRSDHAIPGRNIFLDHLHPTIKGNRLLALALLETMTEDRIVHPASSWNATAIEQVTQNVECRLDRKAHGVALRNLAQVYGWAGKFEESLELGVRATKLLPDDAEAYYQVGSSAMSMGRTTTAIEHLKHALKLKPKHLKAHNDLGVALQSNNELDEAITHYRVLLKLKPHFAKAHCNLGKALQLQCKFDEAIRHYRTSLQIKPDFAVAHFNLGIALGLTGKLNDALFHFREATHLQPDHADTHSNLGNVLVRQGKTAEGINHYQMAIQIDPNHAEAHKNLGLALQSQGNLTEAGSHYRMALRIKPEFPGAHYNLAVNLTMNNNIEGAIVHFRESVRLNPAYLMTLNNMLWAMATNVYSKQHASKTTLRLAEVACEMTNHQDPRILDTLAAAYAAADQFDQAVETADQAIILASADQAHDLAEQIRERLKLYKESSPYRESVHDPRTHNNSYGQNKGVSPK